MALDTNSYFYYINQREEDNGQRIDKKKTGSG